MSLGGNDLVITNADGESHGYVLANDRTYGEPIVHTATPPNVPGAGGYSTPAQAGGQYDVRDSEGDKAIAHIDWTLGAGQRSLDAAGATPYRFWDSKCIDISRPGEMRLLNAATYTDHVASKGPVFAALGYFFLGKTAGKLESSPDGVTWTACEITASPAIDALITCFATDGVAVYFGVSTGSNKGIWKGTYNGTAGHLHFEFTKYGSSGSTEAVKGLAFNGGQLFAAVHTAGPPVTTRVAQVDITTGVISTTSGKTTPAMFNGMTHVALVQAGNATFWIVSQGGQSFVYRIAYDVDSKAMTTERYMEIAPGFVATCAIGYLSTIYIGGYYESKTAGVGRGAIYVCADGYAAPLCEIGEYPEHTLVPGAIENDNRVQSMCAAGKDFYFTTNRGVYRWDIDATGYSHVFDLNSGGAGETEVVWTAGSDYSYDGTDLTNADPVHGRFPTGWTQADTDTASTYRQFTASAFQYTDGSTVSTLRFTAPTGDQWQDVTKLDIFWQKAGSAAVTQANQACTIAPYGVAPYNFEATFSTPLARPATGYTITHVMEYVISKPTWSHGGGIAFLQGGVKTVLTTTPTGGDALDNTTGSTFQIITGYNTADIAYEVKDGTKHAKFIIGSTYTKLLERVQSFTVVEATFFPLGGLKTAAYAVPSGNYYWNYGDTIPAGEYIGTFHWFSGDWSWYVTPPVVKTAVNDPYKTVRCVLIGSTATLTVNGDTSTQLTTTNLFTTSDHLLTLTLLPGVAIDSWNLNSSDAIPSGSETEALGYAGIAWNKGVLLSPYTVPSYATAINISTASQANPCVVTTVEDHGFVSTDSVTIVGNSTAAVNGTWAITKTGDKTFTIALNNASSGTGGYAYDEGLCPDGIAISGDTVAPSGYLTQSESSFNSGSMLKDFRSIDVSHDPLPVGTSLACTVWVDGNAYDLTSISSEAGLTRFSVNLQGHTVKHRLTLNGANESPVVKAVNLVWDFVKVKKTVYTLDCTSGANNGRWSESPQEAIAFLFTAADERCTFEDVFRGEYAGSIEQVQFLQANKSISEGYSGVLKVSVRATA